MVVFCVPNKFRANVPIVFKCVEHILTNPSTIVLNMCHSIYTSHSHSHRYSIAYSWKHTCSWPVCEVSNEVGLLAVDTARTSRVPCNGILARGCSKPSRFW